MKIKVHAVLIFSILTFCLTTVKAQTTGTAEFTPAHLHAAERMIEASDILGRLQKTFAVVIQNQSQQLPEDKRQAYVTAMNKFIAKYITPEEVKKVYTTIYASEFTEDELNSIADFLFTPAGKAMTEKQPELLNKGMQWGQNIALAHKDELETMMKDAMAKK